MRRRLFGWLFGMLVILRVTLAPAHASLLGSVFDAVGRVREALDGLPIRVSLGPAASMTPAQRDSVRRAGLARLASLGEARPAAWAEDIALLSHGVALSFRVADSVSRDVGIQRREPGGGWKSVGRVRADKQGRGVWRDSTSHGRRALELGLALRTTHGTRFVPMPAVPLPGPELTLSARLERDGSTTLALRLPTGRPASLELFDVSGRVMGTLDVSHFTAGVHEVRVPAGMFPERGVYFARLSQNGDWACDRIVVPR